MINIPRIEINELKEIIENDEKKKSQAQLRDFDDVWLTVFTWLRYDKATQLITCAICIDFGKTNTFTKRYIRRRIDVLNEHVDSSNHHEAVSDQIVCKRSK